MKTNPKNLAFWENCPDALVNPNTDSVNGVPVHLWKRVGKNIVPVMDKAEINKRNDDILMNGPDRNIPLEPPVVPTAPQIEHILVPSEAVLERDAMTRRDLIGAGAAIILSLMIASLLAWMML